MKRTGLVVILLLAFWASSALSQESSKETALKLYFLGRTSEAVRPIREYLKAHPDDPDGITWKSIIRMELAFETKGSHESEKIAGNEWNTIWAFGDSEPFQDLPSEKAAWYTAATAKVDWLNNRKPRAYSTISKIVKSHPTLSEAFHLKGQMEFLEADDPRLISFSDDPKSLYAKARQTFSSELASLDDKIPGRRLRAAYWMARSACGEDEFTSKKTLAEMFNGIDVDLTDSIYSPLAKTMLEKGCPKR